MKRIFLEEEKYIYRKICDKNSLLLNTCFLRILALVISPSIFLFSSLVISKAAGNPFFKNLTSNSKNLKIQSFLKYHLNLFEILCPNGVPIFVIY